MARRRKQLPPFEVMRGQREPARPPQGGPPQATPRDDDTADLNAESSPLGRAHSAHYVVRFSQAYALLLGAGLVALVVLSYWVGRYNGRNAGWQASEDRYRREIEERQQVKGRIQSVIADETVQSGTASQTATPAKEPNPFADTRQAGRYYFVVVRYKRDDALAVHQFLREQGVENFLRQDQNTPFFEVIALRGFDRTDGDAPKFQRELDRLGRLWKQRNGPSQFDPSLHKAPKG